MCPGGGSCMCPGGGSCMCLGGGSCMCPGGGSSHCVLPARAQGSGPMDLREELSRQVHVQGGLARAAAVRLAYIAYSRLLLRWTEKPSQEALVSLRRRLEELFEI